VKNENHTSNRGDRSHLINQALRTTVEQQGNAQLKRLLRRGAQARAGRDLSLAREWFALEISLVLIDL